jgi:mono/diheme cytochrome c family protein/uncharacterized membrane protein
MQPGQRIWKAGIARACREFQGRHLKPQPFHEFGGAELLRRQAHRCARRAAGLEHQPIPETSKKERLQPTQGNTQADRSPMGMRLFRPHSQEALARAALQLLICAATRLTLLATVVGALGAFDSVPGIRGRLFAEQPKQPAQEPAQAASSATGALFRQHCARCHGTDGRGTPVRAKFPRVPDFTEPRWHEGRRATDLVRSILEGKEPAMPPFSPKVSAEQARKLVAYLRTFAPGQPKGEEQPADDFEGRFRVLEHQLARLKHQSKNLSESPQATTSRPRAPPIQGAAASVETRAGSRLFRQHCVRCHGVDGTAERARARLPRIPDFTDAGWQHRRTDARLLASILDGKGATMPAFRGKIDEDGARDILTQVRVFGVGQQRPAAGPNSRFPEESRPPEASRGPGEDEEEDQPPEQSFFRQMIGWLGRFHPSMVHFPIALLLAAAVSEVLLIGTGRTQFDSVSRVCVWFGAVTAVPAATLGWFLGGAQLTDPSWILTVHRWLGTSTAACGVVLVCLSEVSRRRGRPARGMFRLALLVSAGLVLGTGFFGGAIIHGLRYYAWPPPASADPSGSDARGDSAFCAFDAVGGAVGGNRSGMSHPTPAWCLGHFPYSVSPLLANGGAERSGALARGATGCQGGLNKR